VPGAEVCGKAIAESFEQRHAVPVADGVADRVADDGPCRRGHADPHRADVEAVAGRQQRGADESDLPWKRNAQAFEADDSADDQVHGNRWIVCRISSTFTPLTMPYAVMRGSNIVRVHCVVRTTHGARSQFPTVPVGSASTTTPPSAKQQPPSGPTSMPTPLNCWRARSASGLLADTTDLEWMRQVYYALLGEAINRPGAEQDPAEQDPDALATLVIDTLLHGEGHATKRRYHP
jgi:hypothetical protein